VYWKSAINKRLPILLVAGVLVLTAGEVWGAERYEVQVRGIGKDEAHNWNLIQIWVRDTLSSKTKELEIPELYAFSAKARILIGQYAVLDVERHYGQSLIVVDLASGLVRERIWGYRVRFSPSGTKVVYTYRYPPRLRVGDVVLGYDFSWVEQAHPPPWPPPVSWLSKNSPANRGVVLYPEVNRLSGDRTPPELTAKGAVRLASPFAWCSDETKIAFLVHRVGRTFLVVLDVSRGLERAGVSSERLLDDTRFYKEAADQQESNLPVGVQVVAQTLEFTADCRAVIVRAWPVGSFGAKEVRLKWK